LSLHILHSITGAIIFLAMLGKIILHYYLNYLHQRNTNLASLYMMPLQYLQRYKQPILHQYFNLKWSCNFLFILALCALVANITIGLIIYL